VGECWSSPEKRSRRSGHTALRLAVRRSSPKFDEIAAALVENGADASGWPLMAMIDRRYLEMVERMLANGANVNAGDRWDSYEDGGVVTPLALAVRNLLWERDRSLDMSESVELVKLLIVHGAIDPDALAQLGHARRRLPEGGWTADTELLARLGLTVESGQSPTPARE
jgi:ankyrin repeat protein